MKWIRPCTIVVAVILGPAESALLGDEVSSRTENSDSLPGVQLEPVTPISASVSSNAANNESNVVVVEEGSESRKPGLTTYQLFQSPKTEYRVYESTTTIIPASASNFGWFSLSSTPLMKSKFVDCDSSFSITGGMGIHFVRGPVTTPIESRLFDFVGGVQWRKTVSPGFSFDVASSVGVYSDFEDSARDGIRLPSHAVGFLDFGLADLVFGVEYVDRDDIKLLPVGGLVLRNQWIRAELVFPRPRVDFAVTESESLYFKGLLGGGSWDIERPDESNDVLTYRSYEVTLGVQSIDEDNNVSALEIGYVFDRDIEFRSSTFEQRLDDSLIIRLVGYH
ncbi:MAG: hypothetical protein KDB27_25635 [Planctomycetales bacterium]|nr:hypothetical protein [Planctomycetales bacterium]